MTSTQFGHGKPASMNVAERAELNRQGAKAAARGDAARTNPLRQRHNRPRCTGENRATWLQRVRAWAHGFELQRLDSAASGRWSMPRSAQHPGAPS